MFIVRADRPQLRRLMSCHRALEGRQHVRHAALLDFEKLPLKKDPLLVGLRSPIAFPSLQERVHLGPPGGLARATGTVPNVSVDHSNAPPWARADVKGGIALYRSAGICAQSSALSPQFVTAAPGATPATAMIDLARHDQVRRIPWG
jgi:hypothetical protein